MVIHVEIYNIDQDTERLLEFSCVCSSLKCKDRSNKINKSFARMGDINMMSRRRFLLFLAEEMTFAASKQIQCRLKGDTSWRRYCDIGAR